ncbi:hypothetical protein CFOL_v3_35509, partial [Cephalotus follicularis]
PTISKCMRAKGIVIKEIEGNHKEQFAMLWDYVEELLRSNPGSTLRIKTERIGGDDGPLLCKRMYVCFDACKKGWLARCRPIICMDVCFLKGLCTGELLTTIGRDENKQMHWCKAYFSTQPKCDIIDNNLAETFNGWILQDRTKAIVSMLEDIRVAIMKRIHEEKIYADKWSGDTAPRIMKKIK